MKYCICVSGGLGCILLNTLITKSVHISCVLTDSQSTEIISLAKQQGILTFVGNPRKGKAKSWMIENAVSFDNILSINYLFILEIDVLSKANNIAVNFHGSLLPKYRGRTPHVWAIINGEKETGITAHLMNEKCDDGDIVRQQVVPICNDDTGASILQKYNNLYPALVCQVIKDIEAGSIIFQKQDINKATYFGKRTPNDGEINWNWQKERICNWVRAQANPYPGAFTFANGNKIIVNKVTFSDYGFTDMMANGLVVNIVNEKPLVKTQNGVIVLEEFITDIEIQKGFILGKKKTLEIEMGGVIMLNYKNCSLSQHKAILSLRNHPQIRKWMTNPKPIAWQSHIDFVESLFHEGDKIYYALFRNSELLGTYNLSKEAEGIWERGIITAPHYQGSGSTAKLEKWIINDLDKKIYSIITAKVKLNNQRSIRYHEKMGYQETHRDNNYIYYNLDIDSMQNKH